MVDMINSQSKLYYYVKFKKDYTFEKYIECVDNDCHRKAQTKFRLNVHSLEIETVDTILKKGMLYMQGYA